MIILDMRKIFTAVLLIMAVASASASTFDPRDLLGGLTGSKDTTNNTSGKTEDKQSGLGGVLGALGGLVNNAMANSNFTVDDLVGTWQYTSPAVTFQSDDALKKIGGAGAATAVESKLEPYYKRLGFDKTSLVVAEDHTFTLKMGVLTLKGTVEKDDTDKSLVFNFNAFGKVPLGKVKANATKAASTLNLTFDATKLIALLTKVSSALNISTLNTVANLLNGYDGIYIGFKLKAAK